MRKEATTTSVDDGLACPILRNMKGTIGGL